MNCLSASRRGFQVVCYAGGGWKRCGISSVTNARNAEECSRNCSKRGDWAERERPQRIWKPHSGNGKSSKSFLSTRSLLWATLWRNFRRKPASQWTTPAFCTIILMRSLMKRGPPKNKSWKRLRGVYPNPLQPDGAQTWRSKRGWLTTSQTQSQLLFQIDRVPRRRVPPLPLFPRNGVESLNHFFVGGVFAFLLIFAVFYVSVCANAIVDVMPQGDRVCGARGLLVNFEDLPRFWIVVHLLFKRIVGAGKVVPRQRPAPFWFGELPKCGMDVKPRPVQIGFVCFVAPVRADFGRKLVERLVSDVLEKRTGFGQRVIDGFLLQAGVPQSFRRVIAPCLEPFFFFARNGVPFSRARSPTVVAMLPNTLLPSPREGSPSFPARNGFSLFRSWRTWPSRVSGCSLWARSFHCLAHWGCGVFLSGIRHPWCTYLSQEKYSLTTRSFWRRLPLNIFKMSPKLVPLFLSFKKRRQ